MSLYVEGDVPFVANGNGNGNGGMWGSDGIWAILLLALLGFGRGYGGYGGGFGGGQGYGDTTGWQLGRLATTNDVASGFSTSEIMSDLNDIILGQSQGFAGVQQTLCQGFSGVNTALLQGFHGVDNAICTLGYQNQQGFNQLGHNLSDCCCTLGRAIDGVNYNMATNTSAIVQAINSGNQKIIDYMQNEKIDTLNRKLATAESALNQCQNNAYLINQIKPCPIPAFITCNPNTGLTYPQGFTQANIGNNGCCGCGNF